MGVDEILVVGNAVAAKFPHVVRQLASHDGPKAGLAPHALPSSVTRLPRAKRMPLSYRSNSGAGKGTAAIHCAGTRPSVALSLGVTHGVDLRRQLGRRHPSSKRLYPTGLDTKSRSFGLQCFWERIGPRLQVRRSHSNAYMPPRSREVRSHATRQLKTNHSPQIFFIAASLALASSNAGCQTELSFRLATAAMLL